MQTLFTIAVALTAGLFLSRLAKPLKLPSVTSYLVAGILVGPYCLGRLGIPGLGFPTRADVTNMKLYTQVALGFIAFAIGNEFRLSQLKKTGKQATVIAIFQACLATCFVDIALIGLHFIIGDKLSIPSALTLGAIAAATAPASTLMVVKQYKAKGTVTNILLPIVAFDDAVGLIIFAISFGVSKALVYGNFNPVSIIIEPLIEIVASLTLGFLMGVLFTLAEKIFLSNSKRLCLSITFVLLTVALSMLSFKIGSVQVGFSPLLVCMMMGAVFCNICDFSEELMSKTDKWTAPLFILFFVISGAELELSVFTDIAIVGIGIVYIITRSAGKYLGARWSASWTKCEPSIIKYLGVTLLPQEGVALGMSIMASALGEHGVLIRNITLFAVLIYELVGPLMTKTALIAADEIHPKETVVDTSDEDDDE